MMDGEHKPPMTDAEKIMRDAILYGTSFYFISEDGEKKWIDPKEVLIEEEPES